MGCRINHRPNLANEITSLSGPSWSATAYDAAGSMTQSPKTGSEATPLYFKYDGWNRLAGMSLNTDGDYADTGEVRYEYDGYGRRITKDYAGGSTTDEDFYFNENYQVVEVRKNGDTDAAQRFLWDVIYIDAPAMVELDTNTDGTRDYRLWPTFDANFNVTSLVTDQGKVVERYAYTPYGERIILNGSRNYADSGADPDGSAFTVDTNGSDVLYGGSGFQGLWFDAETGQWYQRARYSSPVLQFTQRDPTLYIDGLNLYGFELNNPVVIRDPSGTQGTGKARRNLNPTTPRPLVKEVHEVVGKRGRERLSVKLVPVTSSDNCCVLEMRFNRVAQNQAYHSLLVFRSQSGKATYYRAGPTGAPLGIIGSGGAGASSGAKASGVPGAVAGGIIGAFVGSYADDYSGEYGYGPIIAESGSFVPGVWDYVPSAERRFVFKSKDKEECDRVQKALNQYVDAVNAAKVDYDLLGPNSNTFAHEALRRAGIQPPKHLNLSTPGSNDVLLGP